MCAQAARGEHAETGERDHEEAAELARAPVQSGAEHDVTHDDLER
jgi:hypothetical protein